MISATTTTKKMRQFVFNYGVRMGVCVLHEQCAVTYVFMTWSIFHRVYITVYCEFIYIYTYICWLGYVAGIFHGCVNVRFLSLVSFGEFSLLPYLTPNKSTSEQQPNLVFNFFFHLFTFLPSFFTCALLWCACSVHFFFFFFFLVHFIIKTIFG